MIQYFAEDSKIHYFISPKEMSEEEVREEIVLTLLKEDYEMVLEMEPSDHTTLALLEGAIRYYSTKEEFDNYMDEVHSK